MYYANSRSGDVRPPAGFSIHGIDVSWYQLWIDWKTVKEQNKVQFVFIKATEGERMVDRAFSRNWKQARQYGIKRGAYHFFRPQINGEVQALNYLKVVDFQKGDLAPVLDIEVFAGSQKGFYKEIDSWLKIVEEKTGKRPIIYSGRAFYGKHLAKRYPGYPIWVASYRRRKLNLKQRWHFWQHTDRAKINGIVGRVDHNVFNGSETDMGILCF